MLVGVGRGLGGCLLASGGVATLCPLCMRVPHDVGVLLPLLLWPWAPARCLPYKGTALGPALQRSPPAGRRRPALRCRPDPHLVCRPRMWPATWPRLMALGRMRCTTVAPTMLPRWSAGSGGCSRPRMFIITAAVSGEPLRTGSACSTCTCMRGHMHTQEGVRNQGARAHGRKHCATHQGANE